MSGIKCESCQIPSLGRSFRLGMLYNWPKDRIIPMVTLWDKDELENPAFTTSDEMLSSTFSLIADDAKVERESCVGLSGDLSLSVLADLFKVRGAAEYLWSKKSSSNVDRVTLKFSLMSHHKEFSMKALPAAKYQELMQQLGVNATHIVTGIDYGADAFFVFEKEVGSSEYRQEIRGNIEASLTALNVPFVANGSIKAVSKPLKNKDESSYENFRCAFYGDIVLKQNPSTYKEAIEIYKNLPSLFKDCNNGWETVPKVIYLTPLSIFSNRGLPTIIPDKRVSDSLVNQTHDLIDTYDAIENDINALMKSETVGKFVNVVVNLEKFKSIVASLKIRFLRQLVDLLPCIRKGECCESDLGSAVEYMTSKSIASTAALKSWLKLRKHEISQVSRYIDMIIMPTEEEKRTDKIGGVCHAFGDDFDAFVINPKHDSPVVSVHLNMFRKDDPVLECFQKIVESPNKIHEPSSLASSSCWSKDREKCYSLSRTTTQFLSLISANRDQQVRFVVTDYTEQQVEGFKRNDGVLMLYLRGGTIKQEIVSIGKPGKPIPVKNSITHDTITLQWSLPEEMSAAVNKYVIYMKSAGPGNDDQWHNVTDVDGTKNIATISCNGCYVFKVVPDYLYYLGEESDCSDVIRTLGTSKIVRMLLPLKSDKMAVIDCERYRNGYPGKIDDLRSERNYLFHTNKCKSEPNGGYIDQIHTIWWKDYEKLQNHDSYTQWLFPIREPGLNAKAKELQLHEIQKMTKDPNAMERLVKSYNMMLDFYGLQLTNRKTGKVSRSKNWKERFRNLNVPDSKNNLRITRILKCLGEFGYEHYKVPLIKHFLYEIITEGTLEHCFKSCFHYWIEVVKDCKQREELHRYAEGLIKQAKGN